MCSSHSSVYTTYGAHLGPLTHPLASPKVFSSVSSIIYSSHRKNHMQTSKGFFYIKTRGRAFLRSILNLHVCVNLSAECYIEILGPLTECKIGPGKVLDTHPESTRVPLQRSWVSASSSCTFDTPELVLISVSYVCFWVRILWHLLLLFPSSRQLIDK